MLGYFFSIPDVEARKAKTLGNGVNNHEFFQSAPEIRLSELPFSTQVKGEVDRELMFQCRAGINETLDRLPDSVSSELEVLILNFEGGDRGLADENTVILRCDIQKEEQLRVFLHEMGHVTYLSSSEVIQNEYKKLFNASLDGDFVSGYAKENVFEDFAESFLAFVEFGESFSTARSAVLLKKYEFIRKNFFPDRVYNGERQDFGKTFDLTKL